MQISWKETLLHQVWGCLCNVYSMPAVNIKPRWVVSWALVVQAISQKCRTECLSWTPSWQTQVCVWWTLETLQDTSSPPTSPEAVGTVNELCAAKWSLYLPLGHCSEHAHSRQLAGCGNWSSRAKLFPGPGSAASRPAGHQQVCVTPGHT